MTVPDNMPMPERDEFVLVDNVDGVRTITLNRADKANALTAYMLQRMAEAVRTAKEDGVGLIVLRSGSPALFCAGADISEFAEGAEQLELQGKWLRQLMFEMACSVIPIIAVARGTAAGAGVMVLAMVDILIAAEDLSLSCPEFRFHMYPIMVQTVLETRLTSTLARQMCLSARPMSAVSAHGHGWVTNLIPGNEFDSTVNECLAYYLSRRAALQIARRAKLQTEPPADFVNRVLAIEPLMHENFALPGVQERIVSYLANLKGKA